MVEITVEVSERQLAEMDRMLQDRGVRTNQWLEDAVAIYKAVLVTRKKRCRRGKVRRPVRKGRARVEMG